MQTVAECYKKVSKDCFKFIKSKETSKYKFKNKKKMIKSILITISFWIADKANKSNSEEAADNALIALNNWRGLENLLKIFKKMDLKNVELNVCSSTKCGTL